MFLDSVSQWLLPAIATGIAFSLWKGFQFLRQYAYKSPLRHLRGPKGTSIVFGNLNDLIHNHSELTDRWIKEFGETLRFTGFLNRDQLFTVDTYAVNHILTHNDDYQKSSIVRQGLAEVFGESVLVVEGTQHRQQRRIMNPAFGPAQIRTLTDIFLAKADDLRDLWDSETAKDPITRSTGTRIDAIPWLNRVTLDIIGLAGFNYSFNTLDSGGQPNELGEAFSTIFSVTQSVSIFNIILRWFIPMRRLILTAESRKIRAAQDTFTRVGKDLLTKAKAAALGSQAGEAEKTRLRGQDLLSLLVKANTANNIPDSLKLSDEDVIAQMVTLFFSGHETTSTAIAWALYSLTQAPDVQTKLRDELLGVDTDTPSMDELMALPYLDAVVRESLRVHPPIPGIMRIAMRDDVLPVQKPYVDKYGNIRDTIMIAKGDEVVISILAMNRSKELWGPDAHEFKPERWYDIPETVSRIPGVWSHLLTFIGGPRACIGYRFSLVELKAILFSLIRHFEFELAVPASDVGVRTVITRCPILLSDPARQPRLPLLIKPYQRT